jgi:hypothetical protein
MYKCSNCSKGFKYESDYIRHKNRKTLCNKIKNNYECNLCSVKFKYKSKFLEHEKTDKHIKNYNNYNSNIITEDKIDYKLKYEQLLQQFTILNNEKLNADKRIQELETKFKLLETVSNKDINNTDYIYIIHERTFVKINANIYKIGKTKNIKNRLNGYNKGSQLLYTIPCNDCSRMETIILNYLKSNNNYIQAKEYGNEYFICDLNILINDIHTLVKNN